MLLSRLTELRKKKGLSQAQVAEYLRITHQAYSLYESNKRQMSFETLCLLADLYGVSTDYLLGRENGRPPLLSPEEACLIERYRILDKRGRDSVKATMDFEYTQME